MMLLSALHWWPQERTMTLTCKRYQVMDFASVGMNAASVGEEFRMLLKRVTSESSFAIFDKSSYKIGAKERKQQQQKPRRKERE